MSSRPATPELPTTDLFRAVFPGVELRDTPGLNDPPILHGRFAPYNEWTEIHSETEGRFMERFAPGAFTASIERSTPKILFQHGRDPELGDKVIAGPATFRDEPDGAYFSAPMFEGIPTLLEHGLRANQYGASERFNIPPGGQEITRSPKRSEYNPEGLTERTITAANILELGPCTFPAYAGATSGVRSITDQFRPHDLNDELERMVREHPRDLAKRIERLLKSTQGSEEAPKATPPAPSRFRTREEFLQWMSTN